MAVRKMAIRSIKTKWRSTLNQLTASAKWPQNVDLKPNKPPIKPFIDREVYTELIIAKIMKNLIIKQ